MSEFGQNLKNMVIKSFETIGTKAGNFAANAKQKVETYNLVNQQKDLFAALGEKVYQMAGKGTSFPEELAEDLAKIARIDEELKRLSEQEKTEETNETEKAEGSGSAEPEIGREQETVAAEYTAKDDMDVPVIQVENEPAAEEDNRSDCPLSTAINDLFEKMPPMDKMVDKVNSSLDELGDSLKKFSGEFDKQLSDFADQMMGKDDQK